MIGMGACWCPWCRWLCGPKAVNKQFSTSYNGIAFLETTGAGHSNGQLVRYDALAAHHQGHVLLICVSGTPDAFATHEPVVQHSLHSLAPYKARRAPGR